MSTLHKLKRLKQKFFKAKDRDVRFTFKDILFAFGVTFILIGAICGFFAYMAYVAGIPAHVSNSRFGTKYVAEKPAGKPADKANAFFGFSLVGVGLALSVPFVVSKLAEKRFRNLEK